ncbi:MAG TPA: Ldh family oxidoreductase [Devosiaceae bacterium]|jgi:LDH2 family malate/lactate/ureidoglycolate dehydrogenase
MEKLFAPAALTGFAVTLLEAGGMDADKAAVVAGLLVDADLMGHDTHGLNLLPGYLADLERGKLVGSGEPEILNDRGAVSHWDGRWLSGVWLTARALDVAADRALQFGIGAVNIKHAHHTACLQAYLPRITERGLMAIIASSDPSAQSVAAFGGLDPVIGPDPLAIGIPTRGDPVLIDMSSSITTNGMTGRVAAEGGRLRGQWLQDSAGNLSNDPQVLKTDPPGTLLLTGGQDYGQKGYGMALTVEALSHGLSGYGRRNSERRWSASVFVQVIDPAAFSGSTDFLDETDHLVDLCHGSRPHPSLEAVRMPGEQALARKRRALAEGLKLYPGIWERLLASAERLSVPIPPDL